MIDFKNKKILITGATGGIGYSLVEKFNLLGGSILATGTNEDKLNDLKKKYSKIKTIKFDISKHDEIENMIDKATSELDGLDILINNAGITIDNLSLRMKISEDMKSILISRIPMNKLGTGLDVSNTVAFLSSDAASYITGETIHVNGGMYMA